MAAQLPAAAGLPADHRDGAADRLGEHELERAGCNPSSCPSLQPASRPGPGWVRRAPASRFLVHSRAAGS